MSIIAEKRFWPPTLTSSYTICPVPFRADTYRGCVYNCAYCFARDLVNFQRRNRKIGYGQLTLNDPRRFHKWMRHNYGKPNDPRNPVRVALNMRMPLKIGILSDPCPPIELKFKITQAFLNILALYDYPVHIQTKNPEVLAGVLGRVGAGRNICVSVTLISMDDEWVRAVEPGAPSPEQRLKGIKRIVELGYPVFGRVQPAVYPEVIAQLPRLVSAFSDAGTWGFNTEGLKLRVTTGGKEMDLWESGPLAGTKARYKKMGAKNDSDYVIPDELKLQYITLAQELADKYGLVYYSADNSPLGYGVGPECCGTVKLRNYTPFRYDLRSLAFGIRDEDDRLARCRLNFTRATSGGSSMTVKQAIDRMGT